MREMTPKEKFAMDYNLGVKQNPQDFTMDENTLIPNPVTDPLFPNTSKSGSFNKNIGLPNATIGQGVLTISSASQLQPALDALRSLGGGILNLQNGVYLLNKDIEIPAGVTIQGVSRDAAIIDCNGAYSVKIIGTNAYTTGTISATSGDTTITGTGTTFTADMVGQFIMIGGLYYEIVTFIDATHIEISDYSAPSVTGVPTIIASVNFYSVIKDLTIINSDTAGLKIQYAQEPNVNNVIIMDCGDAGMDCDDVVFMKMIVGIYNCRINLDMNNVWGWEINYSDIVLSNTGAGVKLVGCGSATVIDSGFTECAAQGITMQNCSNIAFVSNAIDNNTSHGIELISGNTNIQFYGTNPLSNGGDGIKLTATNNSISLGPLSVKDNGGYGINIANANCNNNVLVGVIASGNVLGSLNDAGTGTLKSTTVNIIP